MHLRRLLIIPIIALLPTVGSAATIVSSGTGAWGTDTTWEGGTFPKPGTTDSVLIGPGHTVTFSPLDVGLTNASNAVATDLGTDNGQSIVINGGALVHAAGTGWLRIGNHGQGTLDIRDGTATLPIGTIQVGVEANGDGTLLIGDGIGAAGSASMNLGNGTNRLTAVNLGNGINSRGTLIIESDGILNGAQNIGAPTVAGGVIRVGREASTLQSLLLVKAGGQLNAKGVVQIADVAGSYGLLHLDGVGATMTQSEVGEFFIGLSGNGSMIVENSAKYIRKSNVTRKDLYVGRNATSTGSLIIRKDGQFIREASVDGANPGNLSVGYAGTGTMTIESGGLFLNQSGNFDYVGYAPGGNGTAYVNEGGAYRSTGTAALYIGFEGANATLGAAKGLFVVNGGELTLGNGTSTSGSGLYLGDRGDGTFRQISGTTSVNKFVMAGRGGKATLDMQGGTLTFNAAFLMGGDSNSDIGAGTAIATQSGGIVNAKDAVSIGLSVGHTASYTMTGGEFHHSNINVTVGEKGTGTLTVGENAKFYDTSAAVFFVGRNDGSNGTMIIDGLLEKSNSATGIRVGHGNTTAENNSTGVGYIGGGGTIRAAGGISIGNYGTIGAGTKTTVDQLIIHGNLNLVSTIGSPPSKSTLHINFDPSSAFGADRITVYGDLTLSNAVIDGQWTSGGATGLDSRYWLIINESSDVFLGDLFFSNAYSSSLNELASQYAQMGAERYVTIDGMEFAMFYQADFATGNLTGGNDLMLSAMGSMVPEPSKAILCLGGLAVVFLRRRRPSKATM